MLIKDEFKCTEGNLGGETIMTLLVSDSYIVDN